MNVFSVCVFKLNFFFIQMHSSVPSNNVCCIDLHNDNKVESDFNSVTASKKKDLYCKNLDSLAVTMGPMSPPSCTFLISVNRFVPMISGASGSTQFSSLFFVAKTVFCIVAVPSCDGREKRTFMEVFFFLVFTCL